MNSTEVIVAARLEGVYGVLRKIQAQHNEFETRCKGSGNCCRIGLVISLAECWNIARNIRRTYWMIAEDKGQEEAELWYLNLVSNLKEALYDKTWDPETHEKMSHCVFYDQGCTIYEYRPMVCRAYGMIAPVQEGVCPRKRLPDGGIELLWDDTVQATIDEFDSVIEFWGEANPQLNYSIYMPAGVLKFLLPSEELQALIADTDEKFWMGALGYKHQINPSNWTETSVEIR